jgi:hypothetical protein
MSVAGKRSSLVSQKHRFGGVFIGRYVGKRVFSLTFRAKKTNLYLTFLRAALRVECATCPLPRPIAESMAKRHNGRLPSVFNFLPANL